jgi:hypothetical protein
MKGIIYGSIDLTFDKAGLMKARQLKVLDLKLTELEKSQLQSKISPTPTNKVDNPFT